MTAITLHVPYNIFLSSTNFLICYFGLLLPTNIIRVFMHKLPHLSFIILCFLAKNSFFLCRRLLPISLVPINTIQLLLTTAAPRVFKRRNLIPQGRLYIATCTSEDYDWTSNSKSDLGHKISSIEIEPIWSTFTSNIIDKNPQYSFSKLNWSVNIQLAKSATDSSKWMGESQTQIVVSCWLIRLKVSPEWFVSVFPTIQRNYFPFSVYTRSLKLMRDSWQDYSFPHLAFL